MHCSGLGCVGRANTGCACMCDPVQLADAVTEACFPDDGQVELFFKLMCVPASVVAR